MRLLAVILAAGLGACAAVPLAPAANERVSTATTASGQPIRLPQGDARFVLSDYEIPPGATLPLHKHPFPRLALIEAGTLEVTNADTGHTVRYGPGDLVVESIDEWHFATNRGSMTVRLKVIDVLPVGATSNLEERRE